MFSGVLRGKDNCMIIRGFCIYIYSGEVRWKQTCMTTLENEASLHFFTFKRQDIQPKTKMLR